MIIVYIVYRSMLIQYSVFFQYFRVWRSGQVWVNKWSISYIYIDMSSQGHSNKKNIYIYLTGAQMRTKINKTQQP